MPENPQKQKEESLLTSIQVSKKFRDHLEGKKVKGQSFESLLKSLIESSHKQSELLNEGEPLIIYLDPAGVRILNGRESIANEFLGTNLIISNEVKKAWAIADKKKAQLIMDGKIMYLCHPEISYALEVMAEGINIPTELTIIQRPGKTIPITASISQKEELAKFLEEDGALESAAKIRQEIQDASQRQAMPDQPKESWNVATIPKTGRIRLTKAAGEIIEWRIKK